MAIPVNGYLGDPARTTLEFQDGIDDLTEALNDPATGLNAKSSSTHNHDSDYADISHDHDADYYPATTNAALKSALNAEPTNWVLRWSGSSQTVTNSWGAGTYLVKLVSDLHIKLTITDGATSANAAPASIGVAFLYGVTGTTSSFTGHQLSLVGNTNNYWTITDVYRAE